MQSEKRNIKIGTISKITAYPVKRPIVHLWKNKIFLYLNYGIPVNFES